MNTPKSSPAQIKLASRLAGVSTASIGKFDKRLKGEKDGERAPLGKRRKFMSVTDTREERTKVGRWVAATCRVTVLLATSWYGVMAGQAR